MRKWTWLFLFFGVLANAWPQSSTPTTKTLDPVHYKMLVDGLSAYLSGDYKRAVSLYQKANGEKQVATGPSYDEGIKWYENRIVEIKREVVTGTPTPTEQELSDQRAEYIYGPAPNLNLKVHSLHELTYYPKYIEKMKGFDVYGNVSLIKQIDSSHYFVAWTGFPYANKDTYTYYLTNAEELNGLYVSEI